MLDKGEITTPEAIEAIAKRSSLNKEEIAHIFNLRTDLMFPLDQNVRLLPGLKKQGFRLYFLSNFPLDIFDEVKTGYYFFKYFDGGIISAEVKLSKPERRIYEILLEKYSLMAEECLFIDDIEVNVRTAEEIGMKGLFTNGSLEISKEVENALKILQDYKSFYLLLKPPCPSGTPLEGGENFLFESILFSSFEKTFNG